MKNLTLLLTFLTLSACSYLGVKSSDDNQLFVAVFQNAIAKAETKYGHAIGIYFIEVEGYELNSEFYSQVKNENSKIQSINDSVQNCENGIVSISSNQRGLAIRVFEIKQVTNKSKEIKWGYWYGCDDYTYQYNTFEKIGGTWQLAEN